jgi:hypothetical protein
MAEMITLSEVGRIAQEVAQRLSANLDVVATMPTGESGKYSEVLLTVRGCSQEPCRVMVSVRRDEPEHHIRAVLADALQKHVNQHKAEA